MEETEKSYQGNQVSSDSHMSGPTEAVPTWDPSSSRSMSGRLRSPSSPSPTTPNGLVIKKRSPSTIMGKIITREETVVEHAEDWRGRAMKYASILVEGNYTANFLGIVVLLDAYLTANDIDSRAAGEDTSRAILICSDICLVLYTSELPLLFLVRGKRLLKDWMVILDIVIILCGYVEILVNLIDSSIGTNSADSPALMAKINVLRVLRLARIVRLMQLLRRSRSLKELQKLVTMLATCLKALLWCFLFCFVIMTIWAMLLVEIVHPIVQEIYEKDGFEDCVQCQRATGSVMDANLLLFKTVIAGDSWGLIAVPVIEAYPLTAIIFCGSLLTLVFGVLNMIVAVVVDTFAEVRESDVMNLAEELDHNLKKDRKFLEKIFNRLDKSGNGELTLQDLMDGARRDPEFQSRLRVMDIDEVDLQQLFEMIDVDGSGAIEAQEFIAPLSRWVRESKTAPRFIKYNMLQALDAQEEILRILSQLAQRFDDVCNGLGVRAPEDANGFYQCSRSQSEDKTEEMEENPEFCVSAADSPTLTPVQEDVDWTPEVVNAIEQPKSSEPNLLQAHLQKERQETEAQASAHQGHKSKEPPDPKDPKVVVPEPAEREPIEGERSSSHHAGAKAVLERLLRGHHADGEVHSAVSRALEVFGTSFEASLKLSMDRGFRQAMAKAEATLQETLENYSSTSWNVLSAPEAHRNRFSSASTVSMGVGDGTNLSRQVSSPSAPSSRRRSVTEHVPRARRISHRKMSGSGGIWALDT